MITKSEKVTLVVSLYHNQDADEKKNVLKITGTLALTYPVCIKVNILKLIYRYYTCFILEIYNKEFIYALSYGLKKQQTFNHTSFVPSLKLSFFIIKYRLFSENSIAKVHK